MRRPHDEEIRDVIEASYALWNANDRHGWLEHWKSVTPGVHTLEDPIGTPPKSGWEILAEVLAPLYKMVTDNGLILQIDDPALANAAHTPSPTVLNTVP